MSNKSDPPPTTLDSDSDDDSNHPEHDDITDEAIVIWRVIAELTRLSPNGDTGAQAVELLMNTFYEIRREALEYSSTLLSDLSEEESRDADNCRNGAEFSAEKIALLRERAAALRMAGEMVYEHMREMVDGQVHFNEAQAHRIAEMADAIIGKDEKKEKSN